MFNHKKLRELMEAKGMSCAELADRCGMKPPNLSTIINGKSVNLRLSTLDRLCKALDCKPSDLIQ